MRNDLLYLAAYTGCVASVLVFLISGGSVPLQQSAAWMAKEVQSASVFFVTSITAAQIQNTYAGTQRVDPLTGVVTPAPSKKVRILIVPGHQPTEGGTEFRGVWERDVVVDIADSLAALLAQNPHYDVMVARSKREWNPLLQSYFDTQATAIETFMQSQKAQMAQHIIDGNVNAEFDQVYHLTTSTQGALQLYGINKWANENSYDITLHLHINDDAERRPRFPGKYSGFTIYVPERTYSNAAASRSVGEALAVRLNAYHATSTLPKEDRGILEDRELIAIGSNNSADGVSLLIEYGYIYEPQFQSATVVPVAVADYAFSTYLGLQDFFKDSTSSKTGSLAFPYDWSTVTQKKNESGPGIYALQAALHHLGFYPPAGKLFSDCPVSGKFGSCTKTALEAYQSARGLEATGQLGPQTRAALSRDLGQSTEQEGQTRDIFKAL